MASGELKFEFSRRWRDIGRLLFGESLTEDQQEAIQRLEDNMRDLEDHWPSPGTGGLPLAYEFDFRDDGSSVYVPPSDSYSQELFMGNEPGTYIVNWSVWLSNTETPGGPILGAIGVSVDGSADFSNSTVVDAVDTTNYINVSGTARMTLTGNPWLYFANFGSEYYYAQGHVTAIQCTTP